MGEGGWWDGKGWEGEGRGRRLLDQNFFIFTVDDPIAVSNLKNYSRFYYKTFSVIFNIRFQFFVSVFPEQDCDFLFESFLFNAKQKNHVLFFNYKLNHLEFREYEK